MGEKNPDMCVLRRILHDFFPSSSSSKLRNDRGKKILNLGEQNFVFPHAANFVVNKCRFWQLIKFWKRKGNL